MMNRGAGGTVAFAHFSSVAAAVAAHGALQGAVVAGAHSRGPLRVQFCKIASSATGVRTGLGDGSPPSGAETQPPTPSEAAIAAARTAQQQLLSVAAAGPGGGQG